MAPSLTEPPLPAGQHYAPGTMQNLSAQACLNGHRPCDGVYWFRLFPRPYWTTRLANGRYVLVVRASDVAGNRVRKDAEIRIANPPL